MVEVMFVSALFVIAMAMILPFFISMLDIYGVSTGKLNVNSDLRQFSSQITRDCARAESITSVTNDQIRLNYRDGSTITYSRTGGPSAGVINRFESATGRLTTMAERVSAVAPSTPFFSLLNTQSSLYIRGRLASPAHARSMTEASDCFEFLVTRRG